MIATYGGGFAVRASTAYWIRDAAVFGQKLVASADRINKDLDKLATGNRLVQMDRIVLGLGDARNQVEVNDKLISRCLRRTVSDELRGPGHYRWQSIRR